MIFYFFDYFCSITSNTIINIMKTKTSSISIVQGVLTTLILISYLLPWITVSFFDTTQSISYLEAIVQSGKLLNRISEMSSDFTMHMSAQDTKITVLIIAIYLTPILTFFNTIFQWGPKAPRVAFYLNIFPFLIGMTILAFASKYHVKPDNLLGVGFYLAILASILSVFIAWTSIGLNYYKTYKRYLKTLTWILLIFIAWITLCQLLYEIPIDNIAMTSTIAFFSIIQYLLSLAFFLHILFVPYAWIIVALTRKRQLAQIAAEEATPTTESQEISSPNPTRTCPQCGKPLDSSWKVCPYCGHDPEKEKEEQTEADNLRFAPPQYREQN